MNHLIGFFASFGLTLFLTWYVRGAAVTNNWVSVPQSYRHIHERPIPRLGGIPIFLAFFIITGGIVLVNRVIGPRFAFSNEKWLGLFGPALLVFSLGLFDDVKNSSPYLKFAVQICAAAWLFSNGYRVTYAFGGKHLGVSLSLTATIFFVVLITNAFNLIDGIDGLAAGSALFSALVIFVITLVHGNFFVSLCSVVLLGCIVAFLRYNFHPATIFLGDSGSLFIGFVLSALGLASGQASPTVIAVAIPVVACGLPILETGLSVMRRFMNNQPLFTADREHIHHKLLALGWTQKQVAIMLYAVSAAFGGISLSFMHGDHRSIILALGIVGVVVWIALQRVGYVEVSELQRVAKRTIEQKRIMTNNLCIRRACENLKRCNSLAEICASIETAFHKNEFDRIELRFPMPIDAGSAADDFEVDVAPMTIDRGHVVYFWNVTNRLALDGADWSLSLPLVSPSSGLRGALILFRNSGTRPLRVDINLLISRFPESVSAALDLALSGRPHRVFSDEGRSDAARAS